MARKIKHQLSFKESGTFESMYKAQQWLTDNGYGYGSSSAGNIPTAVMFGDYHSHGLPEKMKNFTAAEKKMVHGIMTGDNREGPVVVTIYDNH